MGKTLQFRTAYRVSFATKLAAGTLPPDIADIAQQLIFNDYLAATLTGFFLITTWILVLDTLRVSYRIITGKPHPPLSEAPHEFSRKIEGWARN
jgi:carbon starvation protein